MSKQKTIVKPHGTIKPTEGGTAHIPKQIREELGSDEIAFITDAKTAVLFNPNTPKEKIIASLKILIKDIELRGE
ncbi:MAG: hypothetical protein ACTSPG_10140 [Candidatus Hodarchaeales archaeon]